MAKLLTNPDILTDKIPQLTMPTLGYYVLDVAHGINIAGKQSPDGRFKEYKWSRDFAQRLIEMFSENNIRGEIYPTTERVPTYTDKEGNVKEILSKRVEYYNQIAETESYLVVISNHVNASAKKNKAGQPDWDYATGFEVFTSKEDDISDEIAKIFGKNIVAGFPEIVYRYGDNKAFDKEENFTILAGNDKIKPKYWAILIENLFMNNKANIGRLTDYKFFVKWLAESQIKSILETDTMLKNLKNIGKI